MPKVGGGFQGVQSSFFCRERLEDARKTDKLNLWYPVPLPRSTIPYTCRILYQVFISLAWQLSGLWSDVLTPRTKLLVMLDMLRDFCGSASKRFLKTRLHLHKTILCVSAGTQVFRFFHQILRHWFFKRPHIFANWNFPGKYTINLLNQHIVSTTLVFVAFQEESLYY